MSRTGKAMVITLLLASLNSCTNPWIYMAFSDRLRQRLVRCCHVTTLQVRGSQTAARWSSTSSSQPASTSRL